MLLILSFLGLVTYVDKDEYAFYRFILLLICMDIERNPGPNENENNIVNTLEIFHLNARSMRNKLNYIHDIADTFHILCIAETFLDNSITMDSIILEGFNEPLRKDRTNNGGSVVIFVTNELRYKRWPDLKDQNIESIWVEIMLNNYSILVCCFYRNDLINTPSNFITHLQPSIEEALGYTPHVILTGYINIDFFQFE